MRSGVRSAALSAMPIARAGIATVPHVRRGPRPSGCEARRAELLPTPSFHTVLTVPHALNALLLGNKRLLLTLLFRTVSQTLLQCGQQNLGGQLGATMVLPTWDQTLNAHFHLHCLVPAGALAEDGPRWVPTQPRFLFPVRALSTVFRAKFLAAFQQAYHKEALRFAQESAQRGSSTGFTHLLDQLYSQAWVVYAKQPCAGPAQVLADLGRSIHRVAIAHHRLLEVRDGRVRFTYRHRRQGNRVHTHDAGGPGVYPAFSAPYRAPRLPAPAACGLPGQPV